MAKSNRLFHSPWPTLTRAFMVRLPSTSATSSILRTARMKSSSHGSRVLIVPLDGLILAKPLAISVDRILCELMIVPTANRPTAMDSTIRTVRVLLLSRSFSTLCQRELSIGRLPTDVPGDNLTVDQGHDAVASDGHILVVSNQ